MPIVSNAGSPDRLLSWGESIGSATRAVVAWHLHHRTHPEQAYRTCLGLLNLSREYGAVRLENACQKALVLERPFAVLMKGFLGTDPYQCILCKGRLRFAGAMAGEHAPKMLSDRLHRMAKKRWIQTLALDKCA